MRTLIELREAGAFGTGGFGGDKPVGEEHFSLDTLENVWRIPSAQHLARVDEYVYKPEIDPSKRNAYAMVIGLHPGAVLRAIGEIDYEQAVAERFDHGPVEEGDQIVLEGLSLLAEALRDEAQEWAGIRYQRRCMWGQSHDGGIYFRRRFECAGL